MIVFISSPYGADPEGNTKKARDYCRFAVEKGTTPYAPHLLFPQFVSEETGRERALSMGLEMLARCDEVWCFGGISPGMKTEIAEAKKLKKPVRFFIPVKTGTAAFKAMAEKGGPFESIVR